jgi:hypothetical protein
MASLLLEVLMRVGYSLAIILAVLAACQRTESPSSRPSPSPAATVIVAPRADSAPPAAAGPSAAVSPGAEEAAADQDDDILKPWSDEFEIDADPDWYFGYLPMVVTFTAKPLNGIPPFSYVWDFGDGSPTTTGERAVHVYTNKGSYHPAVVGTDGRGQQYRVEFIIDALTRDEYAQAKHVDPALLPTPVPTP